MNKHMVLLALLLFETSLFGMGQDSSLIAMALSSKKAPWSSSEAPDAFDQSADNTLTAKASELLLKQSAKVSPIICHQKYASALSPDASVLGLVERLYKKDIVSLLDLDERVAISAFQVEHDIAYLAVSNTPFPKLAYIEKERAHTIKFSNASGKRNWPDLAITDCLPGNIALNADGTLLALICTPPERTASSPPNFVKVFAIDKQAQLVSIGSYSKKIVNLAFGKNLILELERADGERILKTMGLFDPAQLNSEQVELLQFLHPQLDMHKTSTKMTIELEPRQRDAFVSMPKKYQQTISEFVNFAYPQ